MSMRPSEAGGESLVQYLNDAGETSLAQSLEEWGLTAHHLISKQERSMFLREVGATLAQRAVVMGYLKRIVPATNQYGYPSYEARELRESAEDLKFFAHLETLSAEVQLEAKRSHCYRTYVTTDDIPVWKDHQAPTPADPFVIESTDRWGMRKAEHLQQSDLKQKAAFSAELNAKISLWKGNICELEVDAVVNAANSSLRGGGGIDGAIHTQAGALLDEECVGIGECPTGESRVTHGYKMPAKKIIHTVGPMKECEETLIRSYESVLEAVKREGIRTVAFCCVSTGIYGFPLVHATQVALDTTRKWLEDPQNAAGVDRIIFCVFLEIEHLVYERLLPAYFPQS